MNVAFFSLGLQEAIILASLVLMVWLFWRIFSRAGLPGWLALGMVLPLINVALLFYLAFAKWPALERQELRDRGYDPEGALERWGQPPETRRAGPPEGGTEGHVQQ